MSGQYLQGKQLNYNNSDPWNAMSWCTVNFFMLKVYIASSGTGLGVFSHHSLDVIGACRRFIPPPGQITSIFHCWAEWGFYFCKLCFYHIFICLFRGPQRIWTVWCLQQVDLPNGFALPPASPLATVGASGGVVWVWASVFHSSSHGFLCPGVKMH